MPISFQKKKECIKKDKNIIGEINYRLYEDNIVVFMGSYVDENHRGEGIFSNLSEKILNNLPKNTIVYIPLSGEGKKMLNFFEKKGFTKTTETLRYWGDLENTINIKKVI